MKNELTMAVLQNMNKHLNNDQLKNLNEVLEITLLYYNVEKIEENYDDTNNNQIIKLFLSSKRVEGCSNKSLKYYDFILNKLLFNINKNIINITSNDIRKVLDNYQKSNSVTKVTIDNNRRVLSSFFTWLEQDDYIIKSPVRKIHKIRTTKIIKETISDECIERLRENCENIRDLAIIDLLISSGIRVGELVKLNISDVDLINKECIVLGKGDKERKVYFDAKTKLHLEQYLLSRSDNNDALFVNLQKPHKRLNIAGVEIRLRNLGKKLDINKVHPHKFRRTLATKAIDKGMPMEQVQHLLGHTKVDTTLQYAMVEQNNVKIAHKKYLT